MTYYVDGIPNKVINGVTMYVAVRKGEPVCYGGKVFTDPIFALDYCVFDWVLGLNSDGRPVCRFQRVPCDSATERHWVTESYEVK